MDLANETVIWSGRSFIGDSSRPMSVSYNDQHGIIFQLKTPKIYGELIYSNSVVMGININDWTTNGPQYILEFQYEPDASLASGMPNPILRSRVFFGTNVLETEYEYFELRLADLDNPDIAFKLSQRNYSTNSFSLIYSNNNNYSIGTNKAPRLVRMKPGDEEPRILQAQKMSRWGYHRIDKKIIMMEIVSINIIIVLFWFSKTKRYNMICIKKEKRLTAVKALVALSTVSTMWAQCDYWTDGGTCHAATSNTHAWTYMITQWLENPPSAMKIPFTVTINTTVTDTTSAGTRINWCSDGAFPHGQDYCYNGANSMNCSYSTSTWAQVWVGILPSGCRLDTTDVNIPQTYSYASGGCGG